MGAKLNTSIPNTQTVEQQNKPLCTNKDAKHILEILMTHWLRKSNIFSFPMDIEHVIINTFIYQPIFDRAYIPKSTAYYESIKYDYQFNIILVGNFGVGKTSLLQSFAKTGYMDELKSDFVIRIIQCKQRFIRLNIWDTGGKERFNNGLYKGFYKGMHGVLFCYDTTNKDSLHAIDFWNKECDTFSDCIIAKVLVGTKYDLPSDTMLYDEREIALKYGFENVIKTSARCRKNERAVFKQIASDILTVVEKRVSHPFYH